MKRLTAASSEMNTATLTALTARHGHHRGIGLEAVCHGAVLRSRDAVGHVPLLFFQEGDAAGYFRHLRLHGRSHVGVDRVLAQVEGRLSLGALPGDLCLDFTGSGRRDGEAEDAWGRGDLRAEPLLATR